MANPLNRYEFASEYDPRVAGEYIVQAAIARGIDPNVALRVARSEGLNFYTGDKGSSFGPFQLHYGGIAGGGNRVGGLGDVFTERTGLHASDPRTWRQQVDFALDEAKKGGWGPWHGWTGDKWAGIKNQMAAGANLPAGQMYETGRFVPQERPLQVGREAQGLPPEYLSSQPIAYAEMSQRPDFPSLRGAPQEQQVAAKQPAQQPYSQEDFFAGKHLQQAPVAAPAPAPQTYRPEDFFEGKGPPKAEAPKVVEPTQAPAAQQPESTWGPIQSGIRGLASGLSMGVGDYSTAAAKLGAMADVATGKLSPSGYRERWRDYYNQLEEQRKLYEQQHPIASTVAQEVGNIAGLATPGGLYGRVAGLVGKGVSRAVGPEVGAFLAGQGGMSTLGTAASKFARGAAEGVGQTLASQGLVEEGDRWSPQHIATSGLVGGAVGAAMSPLFGSISPLFKATIAPADRQAAINVMNKHGITVRPSQISQNAKINELDMSIVPGEVNDRQIQEVSEVVSKMAGEGGAPLTPESVKIAKSARGDTLDNIANSTTFAPVRPSLNAELNKIEAALKHSWGPEEIEAFNKFRTKLASELLPGNILPGNRYRYIIRREGMIDKELFKDSPTAARNVRNAFEQMFQATDPAAAAKYAETSAQYKLLDGLEGIVQNHGKIDPTKLASVAKRKGIGGDFAELAEVGKKMSGIDKNGLAKVRAKPQYRTRGVEALGAAGPLAASYLGVYSLPMALAGTGAAGLHYAADTLRQRMLSSPNVARQVLLGQPGNLLRYGQNIENVLTGGAGQAAGGVGFGGNE